MQTNSTFSIIFFTRKSRSNPSKLLIYARITVNGNRAEISLKRCVNIQEWNSFKNRGRGSSSKIQILNRYLDYVYGKLLDCHKQLLEEFKIVVMLTNGVPLETV